MLQNLIDHHLKDTKLFIVVCGSSMSFIEKEVLSYKSPLYGRRTAQFFIEPFNFFTSTEFFPRYTFEENVAAYGILGGVPQYLRNFDDSLNIFENIKNKILDKTSYLFEEPKLLLKQEVREPALYNSIIEAIADGASKLNEISTKVGIENDKCAKYISTLIDLQIIEKITPIDIKENSRKSIYRIKDNFFRFWYRFVFYNKSLIEQGLIDFVIEEKIKPFMNDFLGLVYEDICLDYIKLLNRDKKLPFIAEKIGKWWGNNPYKKREEEIDIVALNKDNIIFGECKWKNQLVGMETLRDLMEKSTLFNHPNKYYILFSKSGFTDELVEYAKTNSNILLIQKIEVAS
ncbi:ATP-binding protein [Caloramator sp. Dgby_cultured_2]|uniref:ATP-binding protein n=1 Tax=Caloramator sp. Dgby_cultured_2 TaxID=3029174 RepID=UPI00237D32C9|nr:ATP-binding protein [Caloramator sp. Dgby_cultured_2]WDU83040.1 ATP-binding protein [Caloramator sp. Dgby_cultured_2]